MEIPEFCTVEHGRHTLALAWEDWPAGVSLRLPRARRIEIPYCENAGESMFYCTWGNLNVF